MNKIEELKVQTASDEEVRAFMRKHGAHEDIQLSIGIKLSGEASLVCRDAETNEIVWEQQRKNLITDIGRRKWFDDAWANSYVALNSSTETPDYRRSTVVTNSWSTNPVPTSGNLAPSVNTSLLTKTWSTTYGTPSSNRTLGTIALMGPRTDNYGMLTVYAYLLITPPKVQTTSQTLEVVYKISMNPFA